MLILEFRDASPCGLFCLPSSYLLVEKTGGRCQAAAGSPLPIPIVFKES